MGIGIAVRPVTCKSTIYTQRQEILQTTNVQSAECERRAKAQKLCRTLVLAHRNQLVSLGKHTLHDDILVIAMCHIQHEDELLLHIGVVQRIVKDAVSLQCRIAAYYLDGIYRLLHIGQCTERRNLRFDIEPIVDVAVLVRREVQTDSGSKGIVGMFLPSFLEIRAGQSGTHTIAHFPDITLHLGKRRCLCLVHFRYDG